MSPSPDDRLTASQLLFLEWLVDPRPSTGLAQFADGGVLADDDSPSKGTKTQLARQFGITLPAMVKWARTAKFQAAFRQRSEAEVRDPTFMLDVIRNVRAIASGEIVGREDALKAAELYARLTGYKAPDELPPESDASKLTTVELELISARS